MTKITRTPQSHCFTRSVAAATRKISACILPAALLAVVPILSASSPAPSKTGGTLSGSDGNVMDPLGEVQIFCGFCIETTDYVPLAQHFAISDRDGLHWGGHHGPSVGEEGADPDGYHPNFLPGTCLLHGFCGYAAAEMDPSVLTDMIALAVAVGDMAGLETLASMPGVAVNASRSAIQVAGCDGETIVGHVPVAIDVLDAVETAATEQLDAGF